MCFFGNLLEVFWVILKAILGEVMPSQYYQGAMKVLCELVSGQYFYMKVQP